ncbi:MULTISPECIES: hypothetical protein [unclassified Sinorhizobium]|uniref:hypothetical protein n=1 Tax=unclassified Sinorhizobium TaxID=2613772 RepID=UPI0024C3CE66|nr:MULTISPECIES: hypothetical protein [unclassified Sinorhizobium]MDK1377611.1 hypothetical protein [Sinorhizobium sp. 6-70]MDK1480953.1 hypothetical protein [Sinorhizobium sp. 6-117]
MKAQTRISVGLIDSRNGMVRGVFALLLAAAVSGCSATADQSIRTSSLTKQLGYPALSSKPVAAKQVVVQRAAKLERAAYLGRAPYICTPSGFGSTSRCFLR